MFPSATPNCFLAMDRCILRYSDLEIKEEGSSLSLPAYNLHQRLSMVGKNVTEIPKFRARAD